ncbi:MAG: hypothetical protein KC620_08135 [Myxococcales bacterium]|nr:hypothetical protein [Myxococcales bacterium]
MKRTPLVLLALGAALWLGACDDDPSSGLVPDAAGAGGQGGMGGGAGGMGGGAGGAGGDALQLDRHVGRLTIEQLANSIPIITDGLRWTEDFGNGPVDMLMVLSPTLGAPDYLRVTEENLEPTLIIAKFLQDASQRICLRWVERDARLAASDRSLVQSEDWASTDPARVRENLRRLQLRFYARHLESAEDEALDPLYDLFVNASSTAPADRAARDGWLAVCIAMMTDPEFILY